MNTLIKILCLSVVSFIFSSSHGMMTYIINEYEFGVEVGGFTTPDLKDNEFIKFSGYYMYFISDIGAMGEDYSSTLGPIGFPGDQYLGEGSNLNYFGGGGYFYTPIKRDKSIFLQSTLGLFYFYENFHNMYYDSFQILGNNGYYHTEGYSNSKHSLGFDIGSNIIFGLGKVKLTNNQQKSSYPIYMSLGGSISTKGIFSVKIGLCL